MDEEEEKSHNLAQKTTKHQMVGQYEANDKDQNYTNSVKINRWT